MPIDPQTAYTEALRLLKNIATPYGFVAAETDKDNYYRVWSRDGVIIGMVALLTEDDQLRETFKQSLLTLASYQGEHGEIPSNVAPVQKKVSYGGTTGRVDANLWFIIGCAQYYKYTSDVAFLEQLFPKLKKVIFLLGAWEFNQKGLIFVPPTGDWADEYIHQGYVLYDQVLYYRALVEYAEILNILKKDAQGIQTKYEHLKKLIKTNFWLYDNRDEDEIYHPVLFEKGQQSRLTDVEHWAPFFSPIGYGFRFDAFANILVSLFGLSNQIQNEKVDQYFAKLIEKKGYLIPAFDPVINPIDAEWEDLQMSFSYNFKNNPYEFHNGGLWPMVTGFYVLDLGQRNKTNIARQYQQGINQANYLHQDKDQNWGFFEFLHGKKKNPLGTARQGWSAAATIFAHYALQNNTPVFRS